MPFNLSTFTIKSSCYPTKRSTKSRTCNVPFIFHRA